jgi:hypothetical protein
MSTIHLLQAGKGGQNTHISSQSATRRWRVRVSGLALFLLMGSMLHLSLLSPGVRADSAQNHVATIGGCPLFPANNVWNQDISALPVHPRSAAYIGSIGLSGRVHADFGAGLYEGQPIGIPYITVPAQQAGVPVSFEYSDESDPGPYPIPANTPIEGGPQSQGDRHVLVVQSGTCKLYEMFASVPQANGSWHAGSGAVWNLQSNVLRPRGWTSADAAGLPVLPGLVRYEEVASGLIAHALRFTVQRTQRAYTWPARHYASSATDASLPPMGLRVRLKASFDVSGFSPQNRIILTALKRYGMYVADNGSNWFLSGAPDNRWNNDDLARLGALHGSDFEAVDTSALQVNPDSGQSSLAPVIPTPAPTQANPLPTQSSGTATAQAQQKATATPAGHRPVQVSIPTQPSIANVPTTQDHKLKSKASPDQVNAPSFLLPLGIFGGSFLLISGAIFLRKRKRSPSTPIQ